MVKGRPNRGVAQCVSRSAGELSAGSSPAEPAARNRLSATLRELQLRQSLVSILSMTRGWAAPETVEAVERVGMPGGEKRRAPATDWIDVIARAFHAYIAGDFSIAAALADEALELALREGNPTALAHTCT